MPPSEDYTPLLQAVGDGVRLAVRVVPGASRDRVAGLHGETLKVTVQAPPERGRANARVLRLLAKCLGVPASSVRLLSGATSRDKAVLLVGWTLEDAQKKVAQLLTPN